jgi:hypothetical protein
VVKARSCIALGSGLICAFVSPAWSQSPQPPTATEAFNLRQKCDQIAQKLVADITAANSKVAGVTDSTSAVSHYSFSRASCYVLITSNTYFASSSRTTITTSLAEGQGGNELAHFTTELGVGEKRDTVKSGEVSDPSYAGKPTDPETFGQREWHAWGATMYEWAEKYINLKMAEP